MRQLEPIRFTQNGSNYAGKILLRVLRSLRSCPRGSFTYNNPIAIITICILFLVGRAGLVWR